MKLTPISCDDFPKLLVYICTEYNIDPDSLWVESVDLGSDTDQPNNGKFEVTFTYERFVRP